MKRYGIDTRLKWPNDIYVGKRKLAGILNGFSYLGSTISTYGLGYIAEKWQWPAVFTTLLTVCGVIIVIGLSYSIPTFIHGRIASKNK